MRTFADITIDELIRQGKAVLEQSDYEKALDSYTVWKSRIQTYAIKNGFSRELQDQLKVRAHFVRNEFRNRIHQKFKECCKRCFTAL